MTIKKLEKRYLIMAENLKNDLSKCTIKDDKYYWLSGRLFEIEYLLNSLKCKV